MKKRANGEGSVYQRKRDGKWIAAIGKRDGSRKTLCFATQREALAAKNAAVVARDQGKLFVTDPSLRDNLSTWVEETIRPTRGIRTYLAYEQDIRLHILPMLGHLHLAQLTVRHLQQLYQHRRAAGAATSSIARLHEVLHHALRDAVRWELVVRNVADQLDPPHRRQEERLVLTPEQLGQLLSVVKGNRLEALYVLVCTTGMREGELLGLRWSDVDLAARSLLVQRTLGSIPKQGFVSTPPKTASSQRRLTLTELAIRALILHRERQEEEQRRAGPGWQEQNLVFCTRKGTPLSAGHLLYQHFRQLLVTAGLPQVTFHDLRHSVATMLLA
ncbi:site-specific integrase [Ktedonosporobacter rubrisoli]|uniref:Site-specific integrase n=1 Tax=Ktedonosporobacter rubrisoli TaxID=2509675 RepID=A0A4P6JHX4_KTERU|nr:tyrosine-type recombinase/integrase [Ktedonosporobacter rubrisoli]QBD74645.1 site-specific integrase [Ktedonosporobacter rubrisoli]